MLSLKEFSQITLVATAGVLLFAQETAVAAQNCEPFPVAGSGIAVNQRELEAFTYQDRCDLLKNSVLAEGRINYQTVIDLSYHPGAITPALLQRKNRWREEARNLGAEFVSDYGNCNQPAEVTYTATNNAAKNRSRVVAEYEAKKNRITMTPEANPQALLHEAGHTIQRDSIIRSKTSSRSLQSIGSSLKESLSAMQLKNRSERSEYDYLIYLLNQEEFEVRLQDLNRFYGLMTNSPILDAGESLVALSLLGMELSKEELRPLTLGSGAVLQEFDVEAFLQHDQSRYGAGSGQGFEDAHELIVLRRLCKKVAPQLWPKILRKILIEAPGHL